MDPDEALAIFRTAAERLDAKHDEDSKLENTEVKNKDVKVEKKSNKKVKDVEQNQKPPPTPKPKAQKKAPAKKKDNDEDTDPNSVKKLNKEKITELCMDLQKIINDPENMKSKSYYYKKKRSDLEGDYYRLKALATGKTISEFPKSKPNIFLPDGSKLNNTQVQDEEEPGQEEESYEEPQPIQRKPFSEATQEKMAKGLFGMHMASFKILEAVSYSHEDKIGPTLRGVTQGMYSAQDDYIDVMKDMVEDYTEYLAFMSDPFSRYMMLNVCVLGSVAVDNSLKKKEEPVYGTVYDEEEE